MAKIDNQSGLVLGTNLFLHIQEVEDVDITVTTAGTTITQSAGDFTAVSSVGGIEGSGFTDGDVIAVSSELNDFTATVSAVGALTMTYSLVSGTDADEGGSGETINLQRVSKFVEYREAGGLLFVDGVEATALHSKMQTLWKDSDLDKYDPLSGSIEPRAKSLYFLNSWDFYQLDTNTIKAHRGGAVQIQDTKASVIKKIYGHITAPTTVDTTDKWFFWNRSDAQITAPTQAVTTGYMDEIELIYDLDNSIDKRGYWLVRCAEPAKTIAMQQIELLYAETVGVTVTNSIDPILGDSTGAKFTDGDITTDANGYFVGTASKNENVAVANTEVGVAGNVAMTESEVGAVITLVGMAGGTVDEKATGTIILSAVPVEGDTITVDDGSNAATIFEFVDALGNETGNNTPVLNGATAITTMTNLVYAINDVTLAGTLNITAGQGVHAQLVEGTSYDFAYDLSYGSQDYEHVHIKYNYLLRQATDINTNVGSPVLRGDKQWPISEFVGNVQTIDGFPIGYLTTNSNEMRLLDQSDTIRKFNTIASYTIVVPQAFIDGTPNPQISIYVADTHGGDNAAIVDNAGATPQQDVVLSAAETSISFAYSTFSGGGHTPNTPLDIAIALNQPGVAEAEVFFGNTIEANTTQKFQLAPSVDPSYIA